MVASKLCLHDALPISGRNDPEKWLAGTPENNPANIGRHPRHRHRPDLEHSLFRSTSIYGRAHLSWSQAASVFFLRSEEHTSELQSRGHLVCRLLLETK